MFHSSKISSIFVDFISTSPKVITQSVSTYAKQDNFIFVKNVDSFIPYSKGDLKNIFYTIVNSGWNNFTFYCPMEYYECVSDMKSFSQDQDLLTHINNFVHPYHSFSNIQTTLSESGEITISIDYLYSLEQVQAIEQEVDRILRQEIQENVSNYDKIKIMHDYIINHTKYDVNRNEDGSSNYLSYLAYGPLFQGYATCNGYTDLMSIILSKFQISNYKVATTPTTTQEESEGHVWNAVFLDGEWLHLDLTWDDPVSRDGKDYLQHKYFLIDNEELKKADQGEVEVTEHYYPSNVYIEFHQKTD